jgi:hypothetical protein
VGGIIVLGRGREGAMGTAGEEGSARRLLYQSGQKQGKKVCVCGGGPIWVWGGGGCQVEE